MLDSIQNLSQEEKDALFDALPLITVLIAGADGKIDESETTWADKLTDIRSYSNEPELHDFYLKVHENFMQRVSWFISKFPAETKEGTAQISAELAKMNDVIAKLPPMIAFKFYKSLTSFAKHIARADGGLFKAWSISTEEAHLINLPMLTKIEQPVEDEDLE